MGKGRGRHHGLGGAVLALALFAGAVGAGEPQETASDPQVVDLPPVYVFARLRPEVAARVPISLATVGGEALEYEGRFTLGRLDSRVANLQLGDQNGTPVLFMRGVGGGGRQVAFEPRTGLYVDGVFMSVPPLMDTLLLDLDRVEVLRGPQGSLFGQNTVSGAVSLTTREPGETFALQSLARVDASGDRRLGLAMDTPLVDDTLLLRVSGHLARGRGETTNRFSGDRPDAYQEAGGRLRLQWRVAPGLRTDLALDTAYHSDDFPTGEAFTSTLGNGPDANPGSFSVALDAPQRDDLRSSGVTGTVRWDSPLGEVTSISAWRSAQRRWAVDLDYSPADALTLDYVDQYRRLSQELRLTSPQDGRPLRWLGGLYAFRQRADSYRALLARQDIQMFVPPLNPGDNLLVEPAIETTSLALFGSVGYALRSDLRVDAGLRLLTLRQQLRYTQQSSAGYQSIGVLPVDDARRSNTEQTLLPDFSVSWDVTPTTMAYARYARASKSGGFDADVLGSRRTDPSAFTEETGDSYEIGVKGSWLDRQLQASLALFLAEYQDYQVSQFRPVGNNLVAPVMSNAGEVRSYGPELELQWRMLPGLTLRNSTAWLSSKYVAFRDGGGAGVDFSGNRTEFAPRWTTNTQLEYLWNSTIGTTTAAIAYSWRSRFHTQPSNRPVFEADIRRLLDAQLTLLEASGRLEFGLYAENLLDEHYLETINRGTLGTLYGRHGPPRSFGIQGRYRY